MNWGSATPESSMLEDESEAKIRESPILQHSAPGSEERAPPVISAGDSDEGNEEASEYVFTSTSYAPRKYLYPEIKPGSAKPLAKPVVKLVDLIMSAAKEEAIDVRKKKICSKSNEDEDGEVKLTENFHILYTLARVAKFENAVIFKQFVVCGLAFLTLLLSILEVEQGGIFSSQYLFLKKNILFNSDFPKNEMSSVYCNYLCGATTVVTLFLILSLLWLYRSYGHFNSSSASINTSLVISIPGKRYLILEILICIIHDPPYLFSCTSNLYPIHFSSGALLAVEESQAVCRYSSDGYVQSSYRVQEVILFLMFFRLYLVVRLLRDCCARMLKQAVPLSLQPRVEYSTYFIAKYAFYKYPLLITVSTAFFLIFFLSYLVRIAETGITNCDPDILGPGYASTLPSLRPSAEHAFWTNIWLVMVTVTTVGYGDTYPRTYPGRFAVSICMAFAVAIAATMTAAITRLIDMSTIELNIYSSIKTYKIESHAATAIQRLFRAHRLGSRDYSDVFSVLKPFIELKTLFDHERNSEIDVPIRKIREIDPVYDSAVKSCISKLDSLESTIRQTSWNLNLTMAKLSDSVDSLNEATKNLKSDLTWIDSYLTDLDKIHKELHLPGVKRDLMQLLTVATKISPSSTVVSTEQRTKIAPRLEKTLSVRSGSSNSLTSFMLKPAEEPLSAMPLRTASSFTRKEALSSLSASLGGKKSSSHEILKFIDHSEGSVQLAEDDVDIVLDDVVDDHLHDTVYSVANVNQVNNETTRDNDDTVIELSHGGSVSLKSVDGNLNVPASSERNRIDSEKQVEDEDEDEDDFEIAVC